ncbi:MAG: winged helix-turn-helix transcriptional regulator [Alphaproteobacteria bacterium]|nr:winged helix-turn-helix transcriptional regulator [Alphaproteobacteria bacterium]
MEYVNPSDDLVPAAEVLRALGHPVRLRIAAGLLDRGCCVGPMTACLGIPQPLVSRHLAVLREAGVVAVERQGRLRRYRVAHPAVRAIVTAALGTEALEAFPEEAA